MERASSAARAEAAEKFEQPKKPDLEIMQGEKKEDKFGEYFQKTLENLSLAELKAKRDYFQNLIKEKYIDQGKALDPEDFLNKEIENIQKVIVKNKNKEDDFVPFPTEIKPDQAFKPGDIVSYTTLKGKIGEYEIADYSKDKPVEGKKGLILKNLDSGRSFAISPKSLDRVELVPDLTEELEIEEAETEKPFLKEDVEFEKVPDEMVPTGEAGELPNMPEIEDKNMPEWWKYAKDAGWDKKEINRTASNDFAEILNIGDNIDIKTVKKKFWNLMNKYHPDKIAEWLDKTPKKFHEEISEYSEYVSSKLSRAFAEFKENIPAQEWFEKGETGEFTKEKTEGEASPEVIEAAREYLEKYGEAEKLWKKVSKEQKKVVNINAGGLFNRKANFIGRIPKKFDTDDGMSGLSGLEIQNYVKLEEKLKKKNKQAELENLKRYDEMLKKLRETVNQIPSPTTNYGYKRGTASREEYERLQNAPWIH